MKKTAKRFDLSGKEKRLLKTQKELSSVKVNEVPQPQTKENIFEVQPQEERAPQENIQADLQTKSPETNNQKEVDTNSIYYVDGHSHGDHSHFFLSKVQPKPKSTTKPAPSINRSDEGCPCCMQAIDLDEVTAALSKVAQNAQGQSANPYGDIADFDSASHWGIFLGIAGPFALLGMTAAYRNIKGTINTKAKLKAVANHLQQDIDKQKLDLNSGTITNQDGTTKNLTDEEKENLGKVIQRLEAFHNSLKYSKFDTNFNLVVPGIINGVASTIVLSSAIVSSPWALPVIALYAGSQTMKNGYDLWRTWNEILPEELRGGVEINVNVGTKKVNQITNSKRKFYAANSFGFSTFTAGAIMTTIGAIPGPHSPAVLPIGLGLLTAGAVSTGITNNIWTARFKPRNAALGVDRKNLNPDQILAEIGHRRELKKLLKNYRDSHLPQKLDQRFAGSVYSALPFCQKKGAKFLHKTNQSRMSKSDSSPSNQTDLIERMVNVTRLLKSTKKKDEVAVMINKISNLEKISEAEKEQFNLFSFDKDKDVFVQIFDAFKELKVDNFVLNKFINNLIGSGSAHDTSIKNKQEYKERLKEVVGEGENREEGDRIIQIPKIFEINEDESVIFRPEVIGTNEKFQSIFEKSLEECLLFSYVDKLKYEQYGLNDFYWALDKQVKKDQKNPNLGLANPLNSVHLPDSPVEPELGINGHGHSHEEGHSHSHKHGHGHGQKNNSVGERPNNSSRVREGSTRVLGGDTHNHEGCDCH
ncbi:MAG: hypothetical protein ACJAS6_001092 [Rickettsiales bacterium]|jgi:hypothetical protein